MSETLTLTPAVELARRISRAGERFRDPSDARVVIAILTCERNRVRADGVRASWLKHVPDSYRVLFVLGRPGQASAIVGDCLYLDCPEAYEHLPEKMHKLLDFSMTNLEFDFLFKTDDDTFLDLERFIAFDKGQAGYIGQFKETAPGEIGRTWHFGKCSDKSYEVPYERPFVCPWATGGGYFLDRAAAAIARAKTEATWREHLFEDVMIGEALTLDPAVRVARARFADFGVINPLLPKDMLYLQETLLERRRMAEELLMSRRDER